jgi:hypothetical protein
LADEFQFKKPIPAVLTDDGFEPQAFEDPSFGKEAPPVFEDPSFGFSPQSYLKIPDIAGESQRLPFTEDGFVPLAFEDPSFG